MASMVLTTSTIISRSCVCVDVLELDWMASMVLTTSTIISR